MDKNRQKHKIWKGLAAGLIGGLAATWVMTRLQNAISQMSESKENGNEEKKKQENGGENATVKAAEAISGTVFDHELKKSEKEFAGNAVHYAFGTSMGALYGAAAEIAPVTSKGYGLPFGTALFLAADEVAVPALGLSESPTEYPVSTHVYGLTSHLIYGVTADLVRRAVLRVL